MAAIIEVILQTRTHLKWPQFTPHCLKVFVWFSWTGNTFILLCLCNCWKQIKVVKQSETNIWKDYLTVERVTSIEQVVLNVTQHHHNNHLFVILSALNDIINSSYVVSVHCHCCFSVRSWPNASCAADDEIAKWQCLMHHFVFLCTAEGHLIHNC